jgi:hypothetical protein
VARLSEDVRNCFQAILNGRHHGFTSALTFYEAENVIYEKLHRSPIYRPADQSTRSLIDLASGISRQLLSLTAFFRFDILDLSRITIERRLVVLSPVIGDLKVGDHIHLITAILSNADMIISTDKDFLRIDRRFPNDNGDEIRCFDTDEVLHHL